MAKKESSFKNMVLTLFIVTAVAAFSLGGVYNLTKGPIAIAKEKKLEAAILKVVPDLLSKQEKLQGKAPTSLYLKAFSAQAMQ